MTDTVTKIILTVENPKINYRYFVSCVPTFTPPTYVIGEPSESSEQSTTMSSEEESYILKRAELNAASASEQRKVQKHCRCGKFVKEGQLMCKACQAKSLLNVAEKH